jgi:hypothetical protein
MMLGEPLRRASRSSRRAIRSITFALRFARAWWFRYYPSRSNALSSGF